MSKPLFLNIGEGQYINVNTIRDVLMLEDDLIKVYYGTNLDVLVEGDYKEKIIKFLKENSLT